MNDPESHLARLKREPIGFQYGVLAELNTRPRTSYLARIDNPYPGFAKKHEENPGHTGENKNAPQSDPNHKAH
jgi:molybdopterin-containing oxidoreductase family iron-sulfur binding subunit